MTKVLVTKSALGYVFATKFLVTKTFDYVFSYQNIWWPNTLTCLFLFFIFYYFSKQPISIRNTTCTLYKQYNLSMLNMLSSIQQRAHILVPTIQKINIERPIIYILQIP